MLRKKAIKTSYSAIAVDNFQYYDLYIVSDLKKILWKWIGDTKMTNTHRHTQE